MGKHRLGVARQFSGVAFGNFRAEIIARLVHDTPGQIQRTITGGSFKFPDWLVNFSFHAGDFSSLGATKAVQAYFLRVLRMR